MGSCARRPRRHSLAQATAGLPTAPLRLCPPRAPSAGTLPLRVSPSKTPVRVDARRGQEARNNMAAQQPMGGMPSMSVAPAHAGLHSHTQAIHSLNPLLAMAAAGFQIPYPSQPYHG